LRKRAQLQGTSKTKQTKNKQMGAK